MSDLGKMEVTQTPKKKFSMSKEVTENGITKRVCVREISNGFIANFSKYGKPDDDQEAKYTDESYEKYFKENPLSDKSEKEEEDKVDALVDLFNPPIK